MNLKEATHEQKKAYVVQLNARIQTVQNELLRLQHERNNLLEIIKEEYKGKPFMDRFTTGRSNSTVSIQRIKPSILSNRTKK